MSSFVSIITVSLYFRNRKYEQEQRKSTYLECTLVVFTMELIEERAQLAELCVSVDEGGGGQGGGGRGGGAKAGGHTSTQGAQALSEPARPAHHLSQQHAEQLQHLLQVL